MATLRLYLSITGPATHTPQTEDTHYLGYLCNDFIFTDWNLCYDTESTGWYSYVCNQVTIAVPYSTYYKHKPMGDLPYISSEQGGLIIRSELIY